MRAHARLFCTAIAVIAAAAPAGAEPGAFDGANAWRHLETIVAYGPRPPAGEAAGAVRAYLRATFETAGATVHEQPFTADTPAGPVAMTNLWAEIPGASERVVIVSAHADTKQLAAVPSFVGANDSASGLAVLLALAEALDGRPPPVTVWLVAFDGEEAYGPWSDTDGVYGSRAFARYLTESGMATRTDALINLDMVGDEHLRLVRDTRSTPWLMERLRATATALGLQRHFPDRPLAITDDHVPFLRAGIPAADLIDFSYGPRSMDNRWWHTKYDTLAHCRADSLAVVGRVVLRVIREWPAAEPAGPR